MTKSIENHLAPIVAKFTSDLVTAIVPLVHDAALAAVKEQILAALGGSPPPRTSARPAKAPKVKPVRKAKAAPPPLASVKPAPRTGKRAQMKCGKCGELGYRADGCGRTHNTAGAKPARKAASDDEDRGAPVLEMAPAQEMQPTAPDRPNGQIRPFAAPAVAAAPARVRTRRPSTAVTPGPELPVISHLALVAMLAADRANNAVGDAGGHVLRAELEPSLIGHADTKREHCSVHGWVGRVAFERDDHEYCVSVEAYSDEACAQCHGTGWVTAKMCKRCDGTGRARVEIEHAPIDNSEKITSDRVSRADDGSRPRREEPRSRSISQKKITREELRVGALLVDDGQDFGPRPTSRSQCREEQRPCPYVACKHHLYLDITEAGSIKMNFPDLEPWELKHSCSLDEADAGAHTLEAVAERMNLTRERARQVEFKAGQTLKLSLERARVVQRDPKPDNVIHDEPEQGATTP